MRFTDFLNEKTVYDSLVNMVAVVTKKDDWVYIKDVVKKARDKGLINDKQFFRLDKELMDIKKSAKIDNKPGSDRTVMTTIQDIIKGVF